MPHSAYTCSTTLVHQEAVEKAAAHMPDSGKLEKTASYFRLLGDPTRVRLRTVRVRSVRRTGHGKIRRIPSAQPAAPRRAGQMPAGGQIGVLFAAG